MYVFNFLAQIDVNYHDINSVTTIDTDHYKGMVECDPLSVDVIGYWGAKMII